MSYEEIVADTNRWIREMMIREQITGYIFLGLCVILLIGMCWLIWVDHKERKAHKVVGGNAYRPTVTDEVQVINGVEFHRMGVAGRR